MGVLTSLPPPFALRLTACDQHSVVAALQHHGERPTAHSLQRLLEGSGDGALRADLEQRSFAVLRADDEAALETLHRAERALLEFFGRDEASKQRCTGRSELGGACGYNRWPQRQQWHGRSIEGRQREPWVSAASLEEALEDAERLLRRTTMRCLEALAGSAGTAAGVGGLGRLLAACAAAGGGGGMASDPSVTDGFLYGATSALERTGASPLEERMGTHTDPGVLTIKRVSDVAGVELQLHDGTWLPVEALAAPDDLIVWAADQLQAAASGDGSRVRALPHRVAVTPGKQRLSLLFELRAPPELRVFTACRHGRSMDACPVCTFYPVR